MLTPGKQRGEKAWKGGEWSHWSVVGQDPKAPAAQLSCHPPIFGYHFMLGFKFFTSPSACRPVICILLGEDPVGLGDCFGFWWAR